MVDLEADADATYLTNYHHKLRGRFWRALEGSAFESEHGDGAPMGLAFSNVFPWGDIEEGDERTVLVASPRESLLATIAEDLRTDREFNVGEMAFRVTDLSALDVDVGEPGTRGTIETATGVFVRLYERHREEYGIEPSRSDADTPTYWRPAHTVEPFRDAITDNLQRKHERFAPSYVPGPRAVDGDLFEGYDLIKTYALPVTVTQGVELDVVVSKWRLDYRVRDDAHRKHLNLALDTGLGGRNALGFGFANVVDRTRPGETELEGEDALA
ncbi:CRISPR repeat RNA endoribonuclease Cas6 [Halarchaeum acidiphilum MH1-52-1]|uniref:CRISPR repeat RNA endoribonuclease Cas6 n=2 Tax=Halarchaeum acidiphilum TaxID=489138 RepID=U2YVE6_9EURY|nr:CRISPR-associated endoribonuclease Cas6 [Halarchaeum acidiphilum]GAD52995.1 CRISPR repeat RNA endoribonuclease Cas6 [Halarchaeum acidiphilum MH1-52-1]